MTAVGLVVGLEGRTWRVTAKGYCAQPQLAERLRYPRRTSSAAGSYGEADWSRLA